MKKIILNSLLFLLLFNYANANNIAVIFDTSNKNFQSQYSDPELGTSRHKVIETITKQFTDSLKAGLYQEGCTAEKIEYGSVTF